MSEVKKVDYSENCNKDDDDLNNHCLECTRFCFPIGCMVGIEEEGGGVNR